MICLYIMDLRFSYVKFIKGNNERLVKYVLLTRPWWTETDLPQFNLCWQMYAPIQKAFSELSQGTQVYSHLPNYKILHSKYHFYKLLTKNFRQDCFKFVMPTYLITSPEKSQFQRHFNYLAGIFVPTLENTLSVEELSTDPRLFKQNLWILKPISMNRGRGITVISSVHEAANHIKQY